VTHRMAPAYRCIAEVLAPVLLVAALGCSRSTPTVSVTPASDENAAPKGNAIPDPVLREAREEAEALLFALLSGELNEDENLALVAEKVQGYTSWSIKSQLLTPSGTAEFKGTLSNPAGKAAFGLTLVKQAGGAWTVATFSGPDLQAGK
jgi:hypothetical protein